MSLADFLLRRLLAMAMVLVASMVLVFVVVRLLPADPAAALATAPGSDAADIAALRGHLGLNGNIVAQLVHYAVDVAHLDLGRSFTTGESVRSALAARLPASLELVLAALLAAIASGVPLGIACAVHPGSALDHAARAVAALFGALPSFVVGLALILVFYTLLGRSGLPVGRLDMALAPPPHITGFLLVDSAAAGDGAAFRSAAGHLLLPATTLAAFAFAPVLRVTRGAMVAALQTDCVRTARALGLPSRMVVLRYAWRQALPAILNTAGFVCAGLVGAAVLVEAIFAWPGICAYAVAALLASDYAPVQGFVLLMAAGFAVLNLLLDVACALLDPGTRLLPSRA